MAKSETGQGNFFQRHAREMLLAGAVVSGGAAVGVYGATSNEINEIRSEQAHLATLPFEGAGSPTELRKDELALEFAGYSTALMIVEASLGVAAGVMISKARKKPEEA